MIRHGAKKKKKEKTRTAGGHKKLYCKKFKLPGVNHHRGHVPCKNQWVYPKYIGNEFATSRNNHAPNESKYGV